MQRRPRSPAGWPSLCWRSLGFPLSASHFPKAQQRLDLHLENLSGYASVADQPGQAPPSQPFVLLGALSAGALQGKQSRAHEMHEHPSRGA